MGAQDIQVLGGGGGGGAVTNPVATSQGGLGANNGAATGIPQFNAGVSSVATLPFNSTLLTGTVPLVAGGMATSLSGTGGLNRFFKQLSAGGTPTVAEITAADLYVTNTLGSGSNGLLDPSIFGFVEDFATDALAATPATPYTKIAVVNTGINTAIGGAAGHPGVLQLATGTTSATGGARLSGHLAYVNPTTGTCIVDFYVNIPTLSTGTDTYLSYAGFTDTLTSFGDPTVAQIGCGILYKQATSANWQVAYSHTGVAMTVAASTVAVATGWHHLTTVINPSASVQFFVDGAELTSAGSPISNTLTPQSSAFLFPMASVLSSLSVVSKVVQCDRWWYVNSGLSR